MKLYHFTAAHLVPLVLKNGLTMGGVPILTNPPSFIPGYRWLTVSKSFKQAWCDPRYSTLPYRRDAVRLTIKIPRECEDSLHYWKIWCRENNYPWAALLNEFGDPSNWRLYEGDIRPGWITAVKLNPFCPLPVEFNLNQGDARVPLGTE